MPVPEILVKLLRFMRGALREQPDVKGDELELEHLSLYHKLAGNTQENQRAEKDVRADIKDAIKSRSSVSFAIALKLPPLVWQDRLERIFVEISKTNRAQALATLAPDTGGEPWPNPSDPLGHPDWRVRANASYALSVMNAVECTEKLCALLHSTASGDKLAYCTVAYALARMQSQAGLEALRQHIFHSEPWLRVDTVGAIARWPLSAIQNHLTTAILSLNPLFDYSSVAVCEVVDPLDLLADTDNQLKDTGSQLLIGMIAAATNTFSMQLLSEFPFAKAWELITTRLHDAPNLFAARAALEIYDLWQSANTENLLPLNVLTSEQIDELRLLASSQAILDCINSVISGSKRTDQAQDQSQLLELQHAIYLAGYLKVAEHQELLLLVAERDHPLRSDAVSALGELALPESARRLIAVANSLYSLKDRTGLPKSSRPVFEANREKSQLYWTILQSLGHISHPSSADFLIEVAEDFAPDRRERAISSLLSQTKNLSSAQRSKAMDIIVRGLDDPATIVRIAALQGVAALNAVALLERVMRYCESQEPSINRQAFATLTALSQTHNQEAQKHVMQKIAHESDPRRKRRYQEVLNI